MDVSNNNYGGQNISLEGKKKKERRANKRKIEKDRKKKGRGAKEISSQIYLSSNCSLLTPGGSYTAVKSYF